MVEGDNVWRVASREPAAPFLKYEDFEGAFDDPAKSRRDNQREAQRALMELLAVDGTGEGSFTCSSPIIEMALSGASASELKDLIAEETKSEEWGYRHWDPDNRKGYDLTEEQARLVRETIRDIHDAYARDAEGDGEEGGWTHFTLTLFNLLVSVSILADYSITGLYLAIIYGASGFLRPICLFGSWRGWIWEAAETKPVIELIHACYMGRHERDFKLEEETYRMLQEIMRSPELFKALTGSCLRGEAGPLLDSVSKETKTKLE